MAADDEHGFFSLFSGKDAPAAFGCLLVLGIVVGVVVWAFFFNPSQSGRKSDASSPMQIQSRSGQSDKPE